jgi:hypothetical protein
MILMLGLDNASYWEYIPNHARTAETHEHGSGFTAALLCGRRCPHPGSHRKPVYEMICGDNSVIFLKELRHAADYAQDVCPDL